MDRVLASAPTREAILAELSEFAVVNIKPGEITTSDIRDEFGWPWQRANNWAERQADAGRLEYVGHRYDPRNGKRVKAWRLADAP